MNGRRLLLIGALAVLSGCGGETAPTADGGSGRDGAVRPRDSGGLVPDGGPGDGAVEEGICGNGVLEAGEECDDGNSEDGDGCEVDCTVSCTADSDCVDEDPCDGQEICDLERSRCVSVTSVDDGTPCPDGVCRAGVCLPTSCGDGEITAPEECDDGNDLGGDGCENDCTASCHGDDECDDGRPCNGAERCAEGRCEAGAALEDGAECDADGDGATRDLCLGRVCLRSVCGDGYLDVARAEECDDGNLRPGDGCERDCRPSCVEDVDCDDGDACTGAERCVDGACAPGAPLSDGASCGGDAGGGICGMACCRPSVCGDGVVDPGAGEVCDDGNSVSGDGCENDCSSTCGADADCDDGDACNGAERCASGVCVAGPSASDGTACDYDGAAATPDVCLGGACAPERCGDGFVGAGEACDDGNSSAGDGCESDCTPSCAADADCDDGEACNGLEQCNSGACAPGTALEDGAGCDVGVLTTCRGGRCASANCGNGAVELLEDCDDGNAVDGDGCDNDCTRTCGSAADCDDGDPCNGMETCDGASVCAPGAPLADGTSCGVADVCVAGGCRAPSCGDGVVSGSAEACDDGNRVDGDGCDADCTLSCTSAADCSDGDACNGLEGCVGGVCVPGTASADGASCAGGAGVCAGGACRAPRCGDGARSGAEACDDGNDVPGDGCECDCTFSCLVSADCDDGDACNGVETCGPAHACVAGAALEDGASCDVDGDPTTSETCFGGTCSRSRCGDGALEPAGGEECDDGNMVSGDGCEADCTLTCEVDADCDDGSTCNGRETCDAAHRCALGVAMADGASCERDGNPSTRDLCVSAVCRRSVCGDGYIDSAAGETCEPPTMGCDPRICQIVMSSATCGDGVLEGLEQCDDGNVAPWDGCRPDCRLEQIVRTDYLEALDGTRGCDLDGDGTIDNAFGGAQTDLARDMINGGIADAIDGGELHMLSYFGDLDDRIGRNDADVTLGFFLGTDADDTFEGSMGEAFTIPPSQLDAMMGPMTTLSPSQIVMTRLVGGPADLASGAGGMLGFTLRDAFVVGNITSDPALRRIDRLRNGMICGSIDAAQLDAIPAPMEVPAECRGPGSSLLDLFVKGCTVALTPFILPTQPDISLEPDGLFSGVILEDRDDDNVIDRCRDGTSGTIIDGVDCAQDPRFDDAFSQALAFSAYWVVIDGVVEPPPP